MKNRILNNQIVIHAEETAPGSWDYKVLVNGHSVGSGRVEGGKLNEPRRIFSNGSRATVYPDGKVLLDNGDKRYQRRVPVEDSGTFMVDSVPQSAAGTLASIIAQELLEGAKKIYIALWDREAAKVVGGGGITTEGFNRRNK